MPGRDPGPSVKDKHLYEELRDEGNSKEKSVGIEGRSSMTKSELVTALRDH